MQLHGAIDLSGKNAAFALGDGDRLIAEANRVMSGRESAQLAGFVTGELARHGYAVADVARWTVGSGPGSFTGMRLAAALVTGWSYALPVVSRCVPSAVAIAAESGVQKGERIGVLFDGRNREILVFEVIFDGARFLPGAVQEVCDQAAAIALLDGSRFDRFAALPDDRAAVLRLTGDGRTGHITEVAALHARHLLSADRPDFNGRLDDLVYIRPAVFV